MGLFCHGDFQSPVYGNSECSKCGDRMKDHDYYEGFVDDEDWMELYG